LGARARRCRAPVPAARLPVEEARTGRDGRSHAQHARSRAAGAAARRRARADPRVRVHAARDRGNPKSRCGNSLSAPLLLFSQVLRRALADTFHQLGVLPPGHLIVDGDDIDLVPPIVAEIEPVSEGLVRLLSGGTAMRGPWRASRLLARRDCAARHFS